MSVIFLGGITADILTIPQYLSKFNSKIDKSKRIRKGFSVSVFSPRVVGIAVARYDFSSRDTRELSLLQGDLIKIYTKMSNGWWKGEVDGRVSPLQDPLTMTDRDCDFSSL